MSIKISLLICLLLLYGNCQFSSNNPAITLDSLSNVDDSTKKSFFTSVPLTFIPPAWKFIEEDFVAAALEYYKDSTKTHLNGFLSIDGVHDSPIHGSDSCDILVSYNVTYNLKELQTTTNYSKDLLQTTIGNYDEVKKYIDLTDDELVFLNNGKENFVFFGEPVCDRMSCNGTYMRCFEDDIALEICCKSSCLYEYCQNGGLCIHEHQLSQPTCQCFVEAGAGFWYIGKQCESILTVWMIVLMIVLPIVFIIAVTVLACCCYYSKKHRIKEKLKYEPDVNLEALSNQAYVENDAGEIVDENETIHAYKTGPPKQKLEAEHIQGRKKSSYSCLEKQNINLSLNSNKTSFESDDHDLWSIEKQEASTIQSLKSDKSSIEEIPSVASFTNIQTSPKKVKMKLRAGWTPSLGPQFFDIKSSVDLSKDSNV